MIGQGVMNFMLSLQPILTDSYSVEIGKFVLPVVSFMFYIILVFSYPFDYFLVNSGGLLRLWANKLRWWPRWPPSF